MEFAEPPAKALFAERSSTIRNSVHTCHRRSDKSFTAPGNRAALRIGPAATGNSQDTDAAGYRQIDSGHPSCCLANRPLTSNPVPGTLEFAPIGSLGRHFCHTTCKTVPADDGQFDPSIPEQITHPARGIPPKLE